MKKKIAAAGATVALVMSMGTAALAAQPADTGNSSNAQLHAGHWGYVQSGMKAKGLPAVTFHATLPDAPGYAPGLGGWADYVKQGGPNK